jgi:hypothetical protein
MVPKRNWRIKPSGKGPIPDSNIYAQDLTMAQVGFRGVGGEIKRSICSSRDYLAGIEDYPTTILNPGALIKKKG